MNCRNQRESLPSCEFVLLVPGRMVNDLIQVSNVLKTGLQPIADGIKDSLIEMFNSMMSSLQPQQQQSSSIMDYLPLIAGGIGISALIFFKK